MDGLLMLVISSLTPWVMERLKFQRWFPLMHPIAPVLNRVTPIVLAGLVAAGVTVEFDHGTLSVSGLVPDQIVRGVMLWVTGYVVQEFSYRRAIK